MKLSYTFRKLSSTYFILLGLCLGQTTGATAESPAPFEIDLKDLGKPIPAPTKVQQVKQQKIKKSSSSSAEKKHAIPSTPSTEGYIRYTIKPGDHLFKVLMRDFGLSNREAESLIPHILQLNNISNTSRLSVGQTILIPSTVHRSTAPAISPHRQEAPHKEIVEPITSTSEPPLPASPALAQTPTIQTTAPEQRIPSPILPATKQTSPPSPERIEPSATEPPSPPASTLDAVNLLWGNKSTNESVKASFMIDGTFIDPAVTPVLPAADGWKIIIDPTGKLAALNGKVEALSKARVRLVTEPIDNSKRFFSALLNAAGFASVEADVTLNFGEIPQLTVFADYKILPAINKKPVLLNVVNEAPCMPGSLRNYLTNAGYEVIEQCTNDPVASVTYHYAVHSMATSKPGELIDSLLHSLNITWSRSHIIESTGEIPFSVKVDRYFVHNNQRYILNCTPGDPFNYTMLRLLELEGYQVLTADPDEGFDQIVTLLLTRLKTPFQSGKQILSPAANSRYEFVIPGFLVSGGGEYGRQKLITNIPLTGIFGILTGVIPENK